MPAPTSSGFQQSNGLKVRPKVGFVGIAADVAFNAVAYRMAGNSMGASVGKGLLQGAYFAMAPALAMTTQMWAPLAGAAVKGAYGLSNSMTERRNTQMRPGSNFKYKDSRAALTMRQASVQAIQGSKMNARNALGGEASLMHRSFKR